jgi:tetratricopeptide (TPR) repeat protein
MPHNWRIIRVFISSTFRDMHAEREELVKRIFPQLRKLCEQRGVIWGEVDLRWGVTDEQKAEGKVLPICLEEIQRCRPYFIGLLGERYGWVPDDIPQDIIQSEPWLAQHLHHSVTELEILHGVLNNPEMADHAFFYFRDSNASKKVEVELAKEPDYKPESKDSPAKLKSLKKLIEESGFPVRKDFPDPKTLGECVLKDLTDVINGLFPVDSQPDTLDREAVEHDAFAVSRARVYIERKKYFNVLDKHAEGNGPPLVVLGESGSGKSALLANWALKFRERINSRDTSGRQPWLLIHFIGASPYSTNWAAMLRRIMGEFKRQYNIRDDIPDRLDTLRSAFASWLHMVAARGRVILILDGLNQLEDRDGAPDLVWMPLRIPENIRLILSTLPGRPLDEIKKRDWPVLSVEPLDEKERRQLITQYLDEYRKSLGPPRVERIANAQQTANPLYLRVLLEELRVFGLHERLDERISYYLEAKTVPKLYNRVLARYEEDYETERPGLVRDTMRFLWAARTGLSEIELIDLLGSEGEPLAHAYWSPLHLAAEESLVNRSGLLGFSHTYLREAVRTRYLFTEESQKTTHLQLADYFQRELPSFRQIKKDDIPGRLDLKIPLHNSYELPWHLAQVQQWARLADLLSDPIFLLVSWSIDPYEVGGYWSQIEANSSFRAVASYTPLLEGDASAYSVYALMLARLYNTLGYSQDAAAVIEKRVEGIKQFGDKRKLAEMLIELGTTLQYYGDLYRAFTVLKEAEVIFKHLRDKRGVAISQHEQALILRHQGQPDLAMKMLRKTEEVFRKTGDDFNLSSCLYAQTNILLGKGAVEQAMSLLEQVERMKRSDGDLDGLQMCIGNEGQALALQGELDMALAKHKEEERICRQIGKKESLARSLCNQAQILHLKGKSDDALKLLENQEQIALEIGDKIALQFDYYVQANIRNDKEQYAEALRLSKKQEELCLALGDQQMLQKSFGLQAEILKKQDEFSEAMMLLKKQEEICRAMNYDTDLRDCLETQADVYRQMDNAKEALDLYAGQEKFWRESGKWHRLMASLIAQGTLYATRLNEPERALKILDEALKIAIEHNAKENADTIRDLMNEVYMHALTKEGRAFWFDQARNKDI